MAFHSFRFLLLFLPFVIVAYRALRKRQPVPAHYFLLAAAIAFYVQSGLGNVAVICLSILANFFFARKIQQAGDHADGGGVNWLRAGLAFNVLLLCYFKYAATFAASTGLGAALGLAPNWRTGFPLGVSFFTIQQIMYLVDVYERLSKASPLPEHALAVAYFPCVSAGPIVRVRNLAKEFNKLTPPTDDGAGLATGLLRFAAGLFKKTVLADSLGLVVAAAFSNSAGLSMAEAWLGSGLYLLQLYLDFSGYSDMAVGIASMLGHTIPENFNNPLIATSITDFWQRWHMTLTNFITTYLYTPIVRSWEKLTLEKAMLSTIIAMVIAGVWHGSGWQFFLFGLIHGIALAAHQGWKGKKMKMSNTAGRVLTLLVVIFAFLFFRSPDLTTTAEMLKATVNLHAVPAASLEILAPAFKSNWRITLLLCLAAPFVCFAGPTAAQFAKNCSWTKALAIGVALLLLTSLLFMNSVPDKGFIYADF